MEAMDLFKVCLGLAVELLLVGGVMYQGARLLKIWLKLRGTDDWL